MTKRITDDRFANKKEKRRLRQRALKQIKASKYNEMALVLGGNKGLAISDLQPAAAVIGASRMGKTRSFFDPAIRNAIHQGCSLIIFDVKGNLLKKHGPYADLMGYNVFCFAPGFEHSDGLNLLDFIPDSSSGKEAFELAKVLNRNFAAKGVASHPFFGPQGDTLLKAAFLLAKTAPYKDMLTAWKFLGLPGLADRLAAAKDFGRFGDGTDGSIPFLIGEAVTALRSVAAANETSSGIVGTACTHFETLIEQSFVPSLLQTTIPLDLKPKQLIFLQTDEQAESATSPLAAAALHMLVKRNLNARTNAVKRNDPNSKPLGVFLDEFTSIRIPDIDQWINRMAEYGAFFALGYQSDAQIRLLYSRDESEAILSSCRNKLIFNTGHPATADKLSSGFGKEDVMVTSRTTSRGVGNTNQQLRQKPLISGPEINRFKPGQFLLSAAGLNYRPMIHRAQLDPREDEIWNLMSEVWEEVCLPERQKRYQQQTRNLNLWVEFSDRGLLASTKLPTRAELEARKKLEEQSDDAAHEGHGRDGDGHPQERTALTP